MFELGKKREQEQREREQREREKREQKEKKLEDMKTKIKIKAMMKSEKIEYEIKTENNEWIIQIATVHGILKINCEKEEENSLYSGVLGKSSIFTLKEENGYFLINDSAKIKIKKEQLKKIRFLLALISIEKGKYRSYIEKKTQIIAYDLTIKSRESAILVVENSLRKLKAMQYYHFPELNKEGLEIYSESDDNFNSEFNLYKRINNFSYKQDEDKIIIHQAIRNVFGYICFERDACIYDKRMEPWFIQMEDNDFLESDEIRINKAVSSILKREILDEHQKLSIIFDVIIAALEMKIIEDKPTNEKSINVEEIKENFEIKGMKEVVDYIFKDGDMEKIQNRMEKSVEMFWDSKKNIREFKLTDYGLIQEINFSESKERKRKRKL